MKEKNNKGFTLIEMLVVVLIIGILAGIALPQYTSAVRKARVAEARIALRALVDAADRYILQHGDADWDSLEDLDVQVPEETNNWDIYIDDVIGNGCLAKADPKWESDYAIEYFSTNYIDGVSTGLRGNFICEASNDNGHKICKSLGGQLIDGHGEFYKI